MLDKKQYDLAGRLRRTHSDLFKAEAVGACQQEGVSIAAVALARGVNASLLRRWLAEANASETPIAIQRTVPVMATESQEAFVPVTMPTNPNEGRIQVEVATKVEASASNGRPRLRENARFCLKS